MTDTEVTNTDRKFLNMLAMVFTGSQGVKYFPFVFVLTGYSRMIVSSSETQKHFLLFTYRCFHCELYEN